MARASLLTLLLSFSLQAAPLLVVSLDGLDHRYLRDRDQLGLKIPNLRKLLAEGAWADKGVIGVVPTVTFPSHTTMVTGVRPDQHGILNNNRPKSEGGERYFFSSFLKVPTLWDAAHKAGMKVAAVHWPVTVGSQSIDWDFPEHFKRRSGHGMDWDATAEKATPGLIARMVARYPSMPQEWIDDRIRGMAAIYLLKYERPSLLLVHLIDHDAEAHETGPFTRQAKAVIEFQDELIGQFLAAKSPEMAVALVSDHGFERVDAIIPVHSLLKGEFQSAGTTLTTNDAAVAAQIRNLKLGREIPAQEWKRFLPNRPVPLAAFEPKPHHRFASSPNDTKLDHPGDHGFWPMREDYRSTFLLWGRGIKKENLGEIDMLSIKGRLAAILGIP